MKNTAIEYLYRDGGNFKHTARIVLEGPMTDEDALMIRGKLDNGSYFIPSQVGLPDLQPYLLQFGPYTEDDHVFHELLDAEKTDETPTCAVSTARLLESFRNVSRWEVAAAMKRLGLPSRLPLRVVVEQDEEEESCSQCGGCRA